MPASLLADVYESLVAAIYLDGGLEAAKTFILKYLDPEIEEVAEGAHAGNFKSRVAAGGPARVQRHAAVSSARRKRPRPQQVLQDRRRHRPAHYPAAWGRNKKEAEQKAAMNALAQINGEPMPFETD